MHLGKDWIYQATGYLKQVEMMEYTSTFAKVLVTELVSWL
jgi:hypothetical protein